MRRSSVCVAALLGVLCQPAAAQVSLAGGTGKLLLTGGVSSIDGAAGGGLTPWAVTGSYASEGQFGASVFGTYWRSSDYTLVDGGVAASWGERIELSLARQDFDTHDSIAPLGFPGLRLKQTIFGVKWRVAGDAVLDSASLMPAIAIGVLHKRLDTLDSFKAVLASLGARDSGTDVYVSATKLFLAQNTLVDLTLRATKANQNGLLGYGSTAYVDLGKIVPALVPKRQRGAYLSTQVAF